MIITIESRSTPEKLIQNILAHSAPPNMCGTFTLPVVNAPREMVMQQSSYSGLPGRVIHTEHGA